MRTNIVIDPDLMSQAIRRPARSRPRRMPYEAGLKLLARQAAYREILKREGKLRWEGDESIDWTKPAPQPAALGVHEPAPRKRGAGR